MNQLSSITGKQTSPFYKAGILSNSRITPRDRMDNLSRPQVRYNVKRRHEIGTVVDLYKKFAQRRTV